ncbi:MAG: hypothetical protein FWF85_03900 [Clostridiales bacterium]|nr:hypothetical protein [Clostridiales bacterium]
MKINGILGPIDIADLGPTLIHEHIATLDQAMCLAYPDWYDYEDTLNRFEIEINKVKAHGVKTFVDATPITLGRNVSLLIDAAKRVNINMLCCTGLYWYEGPWYNALEPEVLAGYLLRDLTKGIQGTDAKAAFAKCSTDALFGASDINRNMIIGTAMAAKEANVPVYTHTSEEPALKQGLYQLDILTANGIEPYRICIGHAFTSNNREYLIELAKSGAYIGCDQVGYENLLPIKDLAATVIYMCEQGYSKHIMLSNDKNITSDFMFGLNKARRSSESWVTGNYSRVHEELIPLLRDGGISQEQIDDMLIKNPRRFFEQQPIR